VIHPGAVCIHPWCFSGVPHLWGHPKPSLRTHWCHWETEAEGQWNWEDRIRDPVPCMLQLQRYIFFSPVGLVHWYQSVWVFYANMM